VSTQITRNTMRCGEECDAGIRNRKGVRRKAVKELKLNRRYNVKTA